MLYDLVVIGGGAAGFYGAIQLAESRRGTRILILEKTTKLLTKVRVSGGGRCNVTHNCFEPVPLSKHYPRGEKFLKELFKIYHAGQVVDWFKSKGVALKTEDDGRMFPTTDNSQTVIKSLMDCALEYSIKMELGCEVVSVSKPGHFEVQCANGKCYEARKILIAAGGSSKVNSYDFIKALGHRILSPVPSLFTFNDSDKQLVDLMGLSVSEGAIRIAGTKYLQVGPILITHWGLSGPAAIKLSSWAAQFLYDARYDVTVLVGWAGNYTETEMVKELQDYKESNPKRTIMIYPLFDIPQRLWARLCTLAAIDEEKVWGEISQRNMNKLVELLIRMPFRIKGKTTFKEEFVTCGGVDLREIDRQTMQSKVAEGIYFAGEVLNVDGETGGFNFQSAWTTAYVAARHLSVVL